MLAMIMAVVSTAHITQGTAAKLAAGEFKDVLSYTPWHNAGWFIHIDDDFTRYADLPDDLAKLMWLVNEQGFNWIHLDPDENILPDIPTYEWE